ncbi:MAG: efflux RND transporter permease subunit [Methylocella sp.]
MEGDLASSSVGKRHDLALGVERLGLISLRFPWLVALVALALAIAAGFGVARLKVDDSLSQLFRSDTPEFRQYEEVTRKFPSSEFDVLAVIEGDSLLDRDSLEKLRDFVTDVQLVDHVEGVISLFSARQPPEGGHMPAPLFPDPLPEGADYDALVKKVMSNEIIRGKLVSEDGKLSMVVIALDPKIVGGKGLDAAVGEIRKTMADDLAGAGLKAELSGVPVMQLEIRTAVERDRMVYNVTGFIAGCLIAILFFRRISFMIVAAGPPLIAILLALGALGWLDFRLNMFLNVMTPLIMVISFSDSMQLTFAARDRILAGQSKYEALRNAILIVGPACVLTHATAALSFTALLFSSSDLIRAFGEAGLVATLIALFTVLLMLPLLGVLLLRHEGSLAVVGRRGDFGVEALRGFCFWIAARMVRRPGVYSLVGLLVVAVLAGVFINLQPRYRLADQAPDKEQAVSASHSLDTKLTGSNPIDVLIEFPKGASLYAPETLDVIARVHAIVERQPGVGNVWSLETLRRWLSEKLGDSNVATLQKYVDLLPEHLTRRFIDAKQDAVVVSARVPDVDASKLLPIVDSIDHSLQGLRAEFPGYKMSVTGLSAIAARNSATMIRKLTRGLTIEFFFVAAFIGLAFRSVVVALVCILPGIFPVVASGALLAATGQGLQFASVVALTVSFGLGLSATIHFLNRLRIEADSGEDYALAVERATVLVGPALILTSIVLACGLALTVLSNLPSLRLFGWLSAFAMIMALTADLLILRPSATFLRRTADALAARRSGQAGKAG